MINIKDQEIKQRLSGFEEVWQRVSNSKSISQAAQKCNVKLMPKKNCRKGKGKYR